MSRLKQLIQEIHRRSLWQVLAIYVAVSWAVIEAADVIVARFSLPDWVYGAAIMLLLVGLPIVVATAFVQEGFTTKSRHDPTLLPAEEQAGRGEPTGPRRLLTWRNAIGGGVLAFAMWGVVATGLLVIGDRGDPASATGSERDEKSLAVLPLDNLSPDPNNEFFAAGIHEDILSQLSKIRALRVISRTSVLQYANSDKDIPTIAEELGVDGIVEGSVRREGDQIRVVLQLISNDDSHLWSETYDRDLSVANIFAIQSDIASQIARAIKAELSPEERRRIEASPTNNLEAYDFFLRGKAYFRRADWSDENTRSVQRMWEQAVELDPGFAHAWAWLSIIYSRAYWFWLDHTEERVRQARAAADRALELNPDLPEGHLALAYYYYHGRRAYDQALRQLDIAGQLLPWDPSLYAAKGYVYRRQGRWEQALESLRKATELDPRNARLLVEIGNTHVNVYRYDEALPFYDQALIIEPESELAAWSKALALLMRDGDLDTYRNLVSVHPEWHLRRHELEFLSRDYDAALSALSNLEAEVIERRRGFYPNLYYEPRSLFAGLTQWAAGEIVSARSSFDAARVILEAAVAESPEDPRRRQALGLAYAGLGLKEAAAREAQTALELLPASKDALLAPYYIHTLAQIHTMVGDHEAAVQRLEQILSVASGNKISVPLIRLDPTWDPLRDHPPFQALLEKYGQ